MRSLEKVALITGGSKGIGEGIVKDLASRGWIVYFTYSTSNIQAIEIQKEHPNTFCYQADVGDYQLAKKLVKEIINKHGKIDCLVNNAGITKDKTIGFMSEANWRSVIDTNLTGTFNYCKFVAKEMIKIKKGVIINISSVSGIIGLPGQTNYSASKAGVISLTKALAKEVGPFGVRVNTISPGFIHTPMTESLDTDRIVQNISLKRMGELEDITGLVHFLTTKDSAYITGHNFVVDGGLAI
ncbi:hypothetical protein AB685_23520 [Bacillus sp. LL01]|uniref:3-oxoacyl-ACP reductase FabG n=1 Tax=Bacillus sp. LL01 TaxID=1665556 RepID=UPI00064D3D75|nr:3-oxoacyl-ACP reductase FabG [Bacillus sp. LL01]KMJ56148.1 hypothetical protein AB685_23520 [Bacillus sp. LL01]